MNEKAFPQHYNQAVRDKVGGMDLRDYFAAKALQGIVVGMENFNRASIANICYELADAMLKARGE